MMKTTVFTDGMIFNGNEFMKGGFAVKDGFFSAVFSGEAMPSPGETADYISLKGARVIPGLVDLHIHGAVGADFSDGDAKGLAEMARYLGENGITSFLPTAMTISKEDYLKAAESCLEVSGNAKEKPVSGILGMRMEGPFLSHGKKGAQNEDFLRLPEISLLKEVREKMEGRTLMVDIAPELPGAKELIKAAGEDIIFSLGHTETNYEDAAQAFDAGAKHITHMFNAMPGLNHREPGLIGAAFDGKNVTAEIIGDGIHVHESALRTAFRLFEGRICLISDGLRCMGMPEGEYILSGQRIIAKDGVARLENGTLAGAASNLYENLRKVISFGIDPAQAIVAATETPAKVIGNKTIGSIEAGKRADFILCDGEWNRLDVYIGGKLL